MRELGYDSRLCITSIIERGYYVNQPSTFDKKTRLQYGVDYFEVAIAQQSKIVVGRKMRVDTTVVETNIHYPTDSSLLGDGVRVLTRLMKKVTAIAGAVGTKLRDRSRSVKLRAVEIARASRSKSAQTQQRMKGLYEKLLPATSRVVGQGKRGDPALRGAS